MTTNYFDSDNSEYGKVGGPTWNSEVFKRAFVLNGGRFQQVMERLERGFSVLVYLPGNCIRAASDFFLAGNTGWELYGRAQKKGETLAEVWGLYTDLAEAIKKWFTPGPGQKQPKSIFENLDMLSDGKGGLDQSNEAKTALFYLTECVRSGVVLGLSDLKAGELPESVRRPFSEEVRLTDIPFERFQSIVPMSLVKKLAGEGKSLPDSTTWLLASRLRWTDPLRAVRIMKTLDGNLGQILAGAAAATRTSQFSAPLPDPNNVPTPTGFEGYTIEMLQESFIRPYREWADYQGSNCEQVLRRLPRGLILYGPPGTGKTKLARWIAESIGIPVRQVSAADLKRADWGQTERMVDELFSSARRASPCVIVLDDADDLLPERSKLEGGLASAESGVVNSFLHAIEGYAGPLQGVLVILTTNRFEYLDRAARSRLARHIRIPFPLTLEQVGQIVSSGFDHYGLTHDDVLKKTLTEFFFSPAGEGTSEKISRKEVRMRMDEGLFAPRDILSGMQLLVGDDPASKGLKRMMQYFHRQGCVTKFEDDAVFSAPELGDQP